ncbi:MAG: 30S ribosomal protein S12 methylthiotransferase RimO [Treponema sp.]|nr:30S ribosomal protein S12 methylthiotransferase RimO [Treponema sp.]
MDQHGCAKNQTDGELLCAYLEKAGFKFTENPQKANFIIINSCGFIESAKKESINAVYSIKAAYPDAKIILAGCLAERYANDLYESMPELDGIFGNGDLSKITDYMKKVSAASKKQTRAAPAVFPQTGVCAAERTRLFGFKGSAFVKITEGCSNNCSFCAIPLIRGAVRSRPAKEIVDEIKALVAGGIYEINLIGQDLAAYSYKNADLAQLLHKISALKGRFIVRTLYIHPDHFNVNILEVFKNDKRFVPYFDIPFQSGDDQIIKAMNRKGTAKQYVSLVKKIRKELPGATLRTTFLTGFPGETDEAAANTQDFLQKIKPMWSGCFAYSREEGTAAYSFKNRVPVRTAKQRAATLEAIQTEITRSQLEKYIGKELDVLIEEIIAPEQDEGLALGRAWFQAPEVDGCVVVRYDADDKSQCSQIKPGNVIKVKVLACTGMDLDSRML